MLKDVAGLEAGYMSKIEGKLRKVIWVPKNTGFPERNKKVLTIKMSKKMLGKGSLVQGHLSSRCQCPQLRKI